MTLDNIPITPITSVYNAVEYVVQRQDKPKEILSLEVRQKFDRWKREDFYKDDHYKEMWDRNWINHDYK
jgi:hypothetical protein